MPSLDVFNSDAFSMQQLTAAINKIDYKPGRLGEMGLFDERGVMTTTVYVEEQEGSLKLINTTARGAPAPKRGTKDRNVRSFIVPHIPYEDTIRADEVQGIRSFGSETEMQAVQSVVNDRLSDMASDMDATLEYHRIGALKGEILDADGSTIYNLFTEFGVSQQTKNFALGTDSTDVRKKCVETRRMIEDTLGGVPFTTIRAVCGRTFFDKLVGHPNVKDAYDRFQEGAALRGDLGRNGRVFEFGGIMFEEYRGEVGGTKYVADGEAYIFASDANIFITRFAPADFNETVNTMGLPRYVRQQLMDFNRGIELHAQTNPLNLCTRPRSVIKATES